MFFLPCILLICSVEQAQGFRRLLTNLMTTNLLKNLHFFFLNNRPIGFTSAFSFTSAFN